jgi:hypothetical protein
MGGDVSAWLQEVTNIPPGSARFREEMQRVLNPKVGGVAAARRQARFAQRRYQQLAAQAGNPNQRFVRIAEGDERTCDGCAQLEGTEGTMEEQRAAGLPGHQECGQNCRCTLQPIETVGNDWQLSGTEAFAILGLLLE